MTVREEVFEHLVSFICDAEDKGLDGIKAARMAFPETPWSVLGEAWAYADQRRTEAWWQSVEKTIDGELIERALTKQGGAS